MSQASRQRGWRIGCDVGSTAIKLVVVEPGGAAARWHCYERHGTRQAAALVRLLHRLADHYPGLLRDARLCFTGSGGRPLAERAGSSFVQEVIAVALATERLCPHAGSIVDLGGQDAKIIIWQRDRRTGRRRKLFSMNDKCAGGTGSVIDRIAGKLALTPADLHAVRGNGRPGHQVAARCGVFAETDINSLQKQGVAAEELIQALFDAIVQQNLSVLTRGATLLPPVLLLGGPHAFLPALVASWRRELPLLWTERGVAWGEDPAAAVQVPPEACYFAALGCVFADAEETGASSAPFAAEALERLERDLGSPALEQGLPALVASRAEQEAICALARQAPPGGLAGRPRRAVVLGLDGGSTSTKAVLLDLEGNLLASAYRLSGGDPVRDAQMVLGELADQAEEQECRLEVRAFGVTGYAKDLLGTLLGADLSLVETVAHARSALQFAPQAEVIVDVGGQDIKVLILRDGRVRDFRLNSQCSAGNGYFLQSTAARFDIPLEEFAAHAFRARRTPEFNFGCAVFLEADIVNFQQLGWQPDEILAGLARVLPKNVWLYVVGEPNLARLGSAFVLQGGTQRNLAAVKAQIDFIRQRVPAARIQVHPHTGEAGAIGVALEILRRGIDRQASRFLGLEVVRGMVVRELPDEATRCSGCGNACVRIVLEARLGDGERRRFVIAPCERGRQLVQTESARSTAAQRGERPPAAPLSGGPRPAPDFAAAGARLAFSRQVTPGHQASRSPRAGATFRRFLTTPARRRARRERGRLRVGIPRALNLYQVAPYFIGYLQALGLGPEQIVVSRQTTGERFRRGSRRGAIDTCYPSKVALAQVHDLVATRRADWIFFPILVNLPVAIHPAVDAWVCPTSQATPDVVRAALTREGDVFAAQGMRYLTPVFHMGEPRFFARQMLRFWGPLLDVTREENRRAMAAGESALRAALGDLRRQALEEILRLEEERRVGIVALGRPYHDDPGLNHGILQDLNRRGYSIFTVSALPRDPAFLDRLFADEIAREVVRGPFDISDVWKNSFSANSNQKVWAAKVVARHPNLVALDMSSFRCGHDAPVLATVEAILEASATPHFAFHDIDENRPTGAIRLRVETIDYSLREYEARRLGRSATPGPPHEAPPAEAPVVVRDEVLV
ncbi:MAG: CoA activase [Candidatus Eisenbacteria sp.]|nr:CoA activase [Candidatus Eisenbacteria bacterium]